MRGRKRVVIALRSRVVAVDGGFQIGGAECICSALDLRQIDGYAFTRAPAVEQRGHHQGRGHDKAQMIRINSLAADGTVLLGMIPQISHARERGQVESPSAVTALRSCGAES